LPHQPAENYAEDRFHEASTGHTVTRLAALIEHTMARPGLTQGKTMNHAQLSDVQIVNLTLLLTIRDSVLSDKPSACCRFALDAAQAERLGAMSVQQVMALVANVGDATLFPPRRDLIALLDVPLPLARPLAAVHATPHQAV
jgi:hypothetical protein